MFQYQQGHYFFHLIMSVVEIKFLETQKQPYLTFGTQRAGFQLGKLIEAKLDRVLFCFI